MRAPVLYAVLALSMTLAACSAPQRRPQRTAHAPAWRHGSATANDILFRAIALVGTPYRYGGNTPDAGFDCSGLVDYVFSDVAGIALPRTADDIGRIDAPDVGRGDLQSGDLVFFHPRGRRISHVGIYVGEGRFVHAPNEGGTVRLDRLDDPYWRDHFSFAKRVL
jgi:cell wall-associated NlpC family hydrolase